MSLSLGSTITYQTFKEGYIISMLAMWGFGVDISRLLVRYCRAYPGAINIHSICMLIIGLLTVLELIVGAVLYSTELTGRKEALEGVFLAQFVLAVFLCIFILAQFILGFIVRALMNRATISGNMLKLKWCHAALGNCMSLLGKALIVTIILLLEPPYDSNTLFKAWMFCLGGFVVIWIVLEVVYRSQTRSIVWKYGFKHKNGHHRKHEEILDNINKRNQHFQDYRSAGIRYIIFDNCMYYIDPDFMHPGGQFIFSIFNGKEVNYLLKGARAAGPDYPRHEHTKYVFKYLENRLVGEIQVQPILLNQKVSDDLIQWRVTANRKSPYFGCNLVTLETDGGYVRQTLKADNFGKFIMMGCSSEQFLSKAFRPFYLIHSQSQFHTARLDRMRKIYQHSYLFEPKPEKAPQPPRLSASLTFLMKEHKNGQFTRFLFSAGKERVFTLTGPYGAGLSLKSSTQGYFVIIAADTGIFAFADLISFLLEKTLYELLRVKASTSTLLELKEQQYYDQLTKVRVLLIASFESSKQFYLSAKIKELLMLNKKHQLGQFDMILNYASGESQEGVSMSRQDFNHVYVKTVLDREKPDRVYFSGPLKLESDIRQIEGKISLNRKIYFV